MMDATGDSTLTFAAMASLVCAGGCACYDSAAGALSMSFDGSSLWAEPFACWNRYVQDGKRLAN